MSLKRLGELRDLVLGSNHEPDYVLRSFMKKESQKDTSLVVESPEKLAKIVPAEEKTVLSLEEVEIILKSGQTLTQEFLENQICPAILQNKKGIKLCTVIMLDGDYNKEEILLQKLILPWMEKYESNELPNEVSEVLSAPSQKEILQAMLQNSSKPDWTLTKSLKKLDVQDSHVQKSLARIIVEQGPNKDLGLGKHMLALIKSLPRTLDVQAYDLWLQAVSMHQSFLSKMCTSELNKIVASKE